MKLRYKEMDKKVYYGEYTLKHWIELLLKNNLELPPYQRNFVWKKEQVKEFIKGIKDGSFIPPVTIGVCNIEAENHNLILDGQQRLSSILLAYYDVYPRENAFPRNDDDLTMADGVAEEDDDDEPVEYLEWSLHMFAKKGPTEQGVRESITDQQYERINYGVDQSFFENNYIPFSFIIPNTNNETEQIDFFSSLFRNINILGTSLSLFESRQSLYFLKKELQSFFNPECCKSLKIELTTKNQAYDFVRTISILSQYKKEQRFNRLAQNYKSKMEKYYEEYIYAVVNDKNEGIFTQFSTIFPNEDFKPRIEKLSEALQDLKYDELHFTSIIDSDVYMFGLVYNVVIEGKSIDYRRKEELLRKLSQKIHQFKNNSDSHKSSPSLLKHMRKRVEESLKIFNRYAIRPVQ